MEVPANVFVKSISVAAAANQALVTPGVVHATALAGSNSWVGQTGAFIPTATLSNWLQAGSGETLTQGFILSEGLILSEGFILSAGFILSESGRPLVKLATEGSLAGEP